MFNERETFLVFADDWGEHPSSCQHIFKHILKEYPVVWVNTVGMRTPRLNRTDAQKALRKLRKMFFPQKNSSSKEKLGKGFQNLTVLQPFMIPYNRGTFRWFNRYSVIKIVRQKLSELGLRYPILVTTVPNACDYIGAFNEKKVIYYCVDDFANWPGHDKALVLCMEEELIKKADIFVATSEKLYQRLEKYGKTTYLLPHGVDLEAFVNIPDNAEHPAVSHISKPRVGYVGLIDDRLDWELIKTLLKRLRDVNFVFIGRQEIEVSFLKEYSNFYILSPIPYSEVPLMLKSMDILMLPYKINEFTQTINPLKLKEYLSSSKKVIGVPLKEIEKYRDYLTIAFNPEDWVNKIKIALEKKIDHPNEKLLKLLKKEDWSTKAQKFLEICLGHLSTI